MTLGSGRAAWACKTGLGYAVAMRRLCGGYAGGIGPTLPHWTSCPSRLLDFTTLRGHTAIVWTKSPSFSLDLYLAEAINS